MTRNRRFVWMFAAACVCGLISSPALAEMSEFVRAGRLLVRFSADAAPAIAPGRVDSQLRSVDPDLGRMQRRAGVRSVQRALPESRRPALAESLGLSRWFVLEVDPSLDPEQLAAEWRTHGDVEWAQPEYLSTDDAAPNDPFYGAEWGHHNTGQMLDYCIACGNHAGGSPVGTPGFDANVEAAWTLLGSYGDASVIIGVIDGGIDMDHPDLTYIPGWDLKDDDEFPQDLSGHGTMVSGIIGAVADNGIGSAGVAPGCSILPIRTGTGTSQRSAGLVYAVDNGAFIANMSWTFYNTLSDSLLESAIDYADQAGLLLVSSSGNRNEDELYLPQSHPAVLCAGAASPCDGRKRSSSLSGETGPSVDEDPNGVSCDNEVWWGSSYGSAVQDGADAVDLIAPIILPTPSYNNIYEEWFGGTSCSTPFVSAVAALVKSQNPTWTAGQVRDALVATATDVVNVESGAGWDRFSGYGLVNAGAAVAWSAPVATPEVPGLASALTLRVSGPNPFREFAGISWAIPQPADMSLRVYDTTGRTVRSLADGFQSAGMHNTRWDGRDVSGRQVASGIYFVTLRTSRDVRTTKVVLQR